MAQEEAITHSAARDELADSSVNFVVRPWVKVDDYLDVRWDMIEAVKERFDQEGISIPFPQRDVHLIPQEGPGQPGPTELRPEPRRDPKGSASQ